MKEPNISRNWTTFSLRAGAPRVYMQVYVKKGGNYQGMARNNEKENTILHHHSSKKRGWVEGGVIERL